MRDLLAPLKPSEKWWFFAGLAALINTILISWATPLHGPLFWLRAFVLTTWDIALLYFIVRIARYRIQKRRKQ